MTFYIETDLEGISGVDDIGQIMDTAGEGYARARQRLMADVNAAVRGLFDGGADRVLVEDGHGCRGNFIDGMLDNRAEMCKMLSDYDFSVVDAVLTIGAHAMAGTMHAFLDHTQSSATWHDYTINGVKCGEIVQTALFFGAYGAPCIMVSGDHAACMEAHVFFDNVNGCGVNIETACVKDAVVRNHALLIENAEAESRIYEAAKRAVKLADKIPPFTVTMPLDITLEFNRSDYCDICHKQGVTERLDARTLRKQVDKITGFRDLLF